MMWTRVSVIMSYSARDIFLTLVGRQRFAALEGAMAMYCQNVIFLRYLHLLLIRVCVTGTTFALSIEAILTLSRKNERNIKDASNRKHEHHQ